MEPHWTTIGIFWVSLILVLITVSATFINWLLFRAQIDPQVIVYVKHDEARPSILLLVIENVGKGLALNVQFELSKPIPFHAFGIDLKTAKQPENMASGPLIDGIPSIGPSASRILVWGQYGGLTKGLGDDIVKVTCNYESQRPNPFRNKKHFTECLIDVKSFTDTDATDPDGARQSAKEIKRIADFIERNNL